MLKPEDARRQLEPLRSNTHVSARLARLRKLPRSLSADGLAALGLFEKGRKFKDWQEPGELSVKSAAALAADAKGRAKVFAALFPTAAEMVEHGWQAVGRLTYTVGYNRRPFRAPARSALFANRQHNYLQAVYKSVAEFADDTLTAEWLAAWAVHLGGHDHFGYLFAGLIDAGGSAVDAVLGTLKDSAANRHEIGGPGRHAGSGHCSAATGRTPGNLSKTCCSRPSVKKGCGNRSSRRATRPSPGRFAGWSRCFSTTT